MSPVRVAGFAATDCCVWSYRHYQPATAPRATVVCLHGIQSHGGWYENSCTQLCQAGYDVYFLDRRGSGLNKGNRGDTPNYHRLLDDVAEFLRAHTGGERRTGKVFLFAISWGGKLAVALQQAHPGLVDGIVLLCPGLFPQVSVPLLRRLAIVWSRLRKPRRLFPIPLNDPDLFTTTPRWRDFIRDDPLALRQATARFLIESVRLDQYLKKAPAHVTVPVLLMLAGKDRIIRNDRTRAFVASFAAGDITLLTYEDAHHTLEFEPNPSVFLGDLQKWLDAHCS